MKNKRVLIVDDEFINNKLISKILTKFGIEPFSITDSREVFDAIEEYYPDLILLDLIMPHQNGFETLKLLKDSVYKDIPVIILSGESGEEAISECLYNGAVDFVAKPVRNLELEARVKSAIKFADLTKKLNRNLQKLEEANRKIEDELEVAKKIQMAVTGDDEFDLDKVSIYSRLEIANKLGGDFFDIKVDDNKIFGCVVDVSGHGVSSALIVMIIKALLKNCENPSEMLSLLHSGVFGLIPRGFFAAINYFYINKDTMKMKMSTAGLYDTILIKKSGEIKFIENKNFAVGFIPSPKYTEVDIQLESGDKIIIHTDGLDESINEEGKMYSRERIIKTCEKYFRHSAKKLLGLLYADRNTFIGDVTPEDDTTVMVIEVK